jgi:hypothetical protein
MTDDGPRIGVDVGSELAAAAAPHVRILVADANQRGRMIDSRLESVEVVPTKPGWSCPSASSVSWRQ